MAFNKEQIEEIISSKEENVIERAYFGKGEQQVEILERVVDRIVEAYYSSANLAGSNENRKNKIPTREGSYATIEAITTVKEKDATDEKPSAIDMRVLNTQSCALYYLLSGSELLRRTWEYCRDTGLHAVELTTEQEVEIKTTIAKSFIDKVVSKSQETIIAEKFPDAPSVGFEWEYGDPLLEMGYYRNNLLYRIGLLTEMATGKTPDLREFLKTRNDTVVGEYIEYKDKPQDEINKRCELLQKRLDEMNQLLTVKQADIEGSTKESTTDTIRSTYSLRKLLELSVAETLIDKNTQNTEEINLLKKIQLWKRILEHEQTPLDTDIDAVALEVLSDVVPTQTDIMARTGAFIDKKEFLPGTREVITRPSYSVKLQMREFLYMHELGGMEGKLAMHMTASGVELNEEHSDIMELRAMLAAAQYFGDSQDFNEDQKAKILAGQAVSGENYIKPVGTQKRICFPYHRPRVSSDNVIKPYANKHDYAVEFRSFPGLVADYDFSGVVRTATFIDVGCWGECFKQRQEKVSNLNDNESTVVEAWNDLLAQWKDLLDEYNIHQPSPKERFEILGDETHKETYSNYLDRIKLLVQQEKEAGIPYEKSFQKKARKMIISYRSKVRGLVTTEQTTTAT